MNGFADHGLDESSFGEKTSFTDGLRTFDAFPKTKTTYSLPSRRGGQITALLLATCLLLTFSELHRWWQGHQTHHFSVEKGVSHDLQINLDVVVAMRCPDLHINVQDASGDRILAGDMLKRDSTNWGQWIDAKGVHRLHGGETLEMEEEQHVHDVLAQGKRGRKFGKTPRLRGEGSACRVYGSLEGNKVQGDFHITARGHGYMEFGEHLDHSAFNFSHIINELSFGPFYPSLLNPLDRTVATTPNHFFKFQYYLSVVPTIYTRDSTSPTTSNTIFTNQYAVTEQSHMVGERAIPGVFFKFDIEPILLTVAEERGGLLALVVRLVNVVSGVIVGGGWCYQLSGWVGEVWGRRKKRKSEGVLHGRPTVEDADDE
ncbi:MAG: hypothetical protein M1830_002552 [Pleopsidium flavum]|nr:MAG: hypothetical protein M1830_002552 [Pleopsidium flavum]